MNNNCVLSRRDTGTVFTSSVIVGLSSEGPGAGLDLSLGGVAPPVWADCGDGDNAGFVTGVGAGDTLTSISLVLTEK